MKNFIKYLGVFVGAMFLGTGIAYAAAFIVPQGGTGQSTFNSSELIYGNGTAALSSVGTTTVTASAPLSLSQPVVKVGGSNSVLSISTSGTWTGNAGTATALAANGTNCSAGNFPLGVDASGAVENCTDAWTEAENTAAAYAAQATTLTVAGTAGQITSSAGAQSLAANRTWTLSLPSHVIFPGNFQVTNSTTTNATTTGSMYLTGVTASRILYVDSAGKVGAAGTGVSGNCVTWGANNTLGDAGAVCGTGGGGVTAVAATYPFLTTGSTGSITLSTAFGTTSTWGMGNNGFVLVGATGIPYVGASSTLALPNTALANSTISGIALGSNLNAHTVSGSLSGTSYNGSAAVSDWALNMANINTWTVRQSFALASSSLFSITGTGYFGGTATSTVDSTGKFTFVTPPVVSTLTGVLLGNSSSPITAASTQTCTNQFVRAMSSTYTATCATVGAADVSLANLSATDATLTFSGTYTGATARTIGINLANANTWTALQTINFASTTAITASGELVVPQNKTVANAGEITTDDTTGQFRWFAASAQQVLPAFETIAVTYGSTTQGMGTSTRYLAPAPGAITVVSAQCEFTNFMGISLYDASSNRANYFVASSTIGTVTFSTNNTFTNAESMRLDIGTSTNIAAAVTGGCRFKYTYTAD